MQVSCDLVDWKWLKGLPGPRARCDVFLEEPVPGKVVHCSAVVPKWDISALTHDEVADALESLADESSGAKARLLRTGLMCVITMEGDPDELGIHAESGCSYATLSPKRVSAAARALDKLDLAAVARELDPRRRKAVERYLNQWAAVIRRASETGMGIVAHYG